MSALAAKPVCARCGNDGSKASLYVTIDARWNHERGVWIMEQRTDDGGSELDCLACDHRSDDPPFPYEIEIAHDDGRERSGS